MKYQSKYRYKISGTNTNFNILLQRQELAEIAANEYYITHGGHLDRSLLVSLLPSYLPDKALDGPAALEQWADLVQTAFDQIKVRIP
jgi:hypothetical protein